MTEPLAIDLPGYVRQKEIEEAEKAFLELEEEEARELALAEAQAEANPQLAELAAQRAEQIEEKRQAALERLRQAEESKAISEELGEEFKAEQAKWEQEELAPQGYEAQMAGIEREAQFVGDDTNQWNPEAKQRRKAKYICVGRNNKITGPFNAAEYWQARQRGEKPSTLLPKLYYLSYVSGKGVRRNDLTREQKERCLGLVTPEIAPKNRRESTLQGKRLTPSQKYTKKANKEDGAAGIAQPPRVIGCLTADDELGATRGDATPFRSFKVDETSPKALPPPGYTEEVCVEEKFADWLQANHNLAEPVPSQTVTQTFRGGQAGNWQPWHFEISLFAFLFQLAGVKMTLEQEGAAIRDLIAQQIGDNPQGIARLRQFFISPTVAEEQLPSNQPYVVDLSKGIEFWEANEAERERLNALANGAFARVMDYVVRNQALVANQLESKLSGLYVEPAAAPAAGGAMPLPLPEEVAAVPAAEVAQPISTPELLAEPEAGFFSLPEGLELPPLPAQAEGESEFPLMEGEGSPSAQGLEFPLGQEFPLVQSEEFQLPGEEIPAEQAAPGETTEIPWRSPGDRFTDPNGINWLVSQEGGKNVFLGFDASGKEVDYQTEDPWPAIPSTL